MGSNILGNKLLNSTFNVLHSLSVYLKNLGLGVGAVKVSMWYIYLLTPPQDSIVKYKRYSVKHQHVWEGLQGRYKLL